MSAVVEQSSRWSRRRWALVVAALTLLQAALALALSQRGTTRPIPPRPEPALRLARAAPARHAEELPGTDPTLFALVNPRGFSGAGWMRFDYAAHELRDWQDAPSWLTLEPGRFGADFRKLAAGSGADRLNIPDKPAPPPAIPAVAPLPVRRQTEWTLSAELRARPLLSELKLPAWPHPDLLDRTVLQVGVNPAGDVLSARVLKTCGVEAADAAAARAFLGARFQPLPRGTSPPAGSALVIGTATIAWLTRAPATNAAALPVVPAP